MAQVSESHATLRIMGDDLMPEEISRLLGCEPTSGQFKGQEIVAPKSGRTRIARSGMWRLDCEARFPEDLDGQISELLKQLTSDLSVWDDIASRFKIDLFVGLMMKERNEGCVVSQESMRQLGERSIALGLDIYAEMND